MILHPGLILVLCAAAFLVLDRLVRWPLPLSLALVAALGAFLGGFGFPFRHLVEGGFGYLTLVLTLFAGAFFGRMMQESGAAEAAAASVLRAACGRVLPALALAGLPVFLVGMFTGVAGIAVLAGGAFAAPALRRMGFEDASAGAFIAVIATAGMIAPPINVPAMMIADGINMPYASLDRALLALALPLALAALLWFARARPSVPRPEPAGWSWVPPLALILAIWIAVRVFDQVLIDPSATLVLVLGALVVLPRLPRGALARALDASFTGTPLMLAGVLVAVGILVQIGALTGVRGWLVISALSLPAPWIYPGLALGLPLLGGVLTALGTASILGVPAALAFIGQDMVLNVAGLAGLSALAEFVPPTAIGAALAAYVVGGTATTGAVIRRSLPPLAVLAVLALLMLAFPQLGRLLG